MKIEIKNRWTGAVIFECEAPNIKAAVELAAEKKISLSGSNLSGSNLSGSNLRGSNLRGSDLREIKKDFLEKLSLLPTESVFLYKSILDGKIDGSQYQGECACFVGTMANAQGKRHDEIAITPDSDSPSERFFLAIRKGDTPENNQVSVIVASWCEEFFAEKGIIKPIRRIVWEEV